MTFETHDAFFSYDSSSRLIKQKNNLTLDEIGLKQNILRVPLSRIPFKDTQERKRGVLQWNLEEKEFGSISLDAFVRKLASNEDLLSWKNVGTLKARYTKKIFNFRSFVGFHYRGLVEISKVFSFSRPSLLPLRPSVPRNA